MSEFKITRRGIIGSAGLIGAIGVGAASAFAAEAGEPHDEEEVGAVEDLMREHGILRRALIVYSETAARLRAGGTMDPEALGRTAQLFRRFGENYHERKLEEAHIFPAVKKAGGPAAALPDILLAQHNRGREITTYILQATKLAKSAAPGSKALASVLDEFVRMYRTHAAREDTIVFPAWKAALSPEELGELGEEFEDIEHAEFGEDGFETAVKEIAEIEESVGLSDLAGFTASPPPHI